MSAVADHFNEGTPDDNVPAQAAIEDTLDYRLIKPVQAGNELVTVLHLTEPTMEQLRKAQAGRAGLAQLAILIQLNTGCLPIVVDRLCQRDMNAIDGFFGRFSPE